MHIETFTGKDETSVDVHLDGHGHGEDAILIGAERGFSCFSSIHSELPNPRHKRSISHLVDAMRRSEQGAYVAWISPDVTGERALVCIQTNRGPFYEAKHSPPTTDAPVWRDFYYRTVFLGLQQLSNLWSPSDIQFHHPTGSGWPPDLLTVSFEAIRNLTLEDNVSFSRINLHGCRGSPTSMECEDSLDELDDVGADSQVHIPFDWEWKDASDLAGLSLPDGIRLGQIPLEGHIDEE